MVEYGRPEPVPGVLPSLPVAMTLKRQKFEVTTYKVTLSKKLHGLGAQVAGTIACYSEDRKACLTLAFVRSGFELPRNKSNEEAHQGLVYLPNEDFHLYVDLLRNERPLYATLSAKNPSSNRLETGLEPVGEGELAGEPDPDDQYSGGIIWV